MSGVVVDFISLGSFVGDGKTARKPCSSVPTSVHQNLPDFKRSTGVSNHHRNQSISPERLWAGPGLRERVLAPKSSRELHGRPSLPTLELCGRSCPAPSFPAHAWSLSSSPGCTCPRHVSERQAVLRRGWLEAFPRAAVSNIAFVIKVCL